MYLDSKTLQSQMLQCYQLHHFPVIWKTRRRLGETAQQFQPCSAWFWGPLGSSPLPEVAEMILDSVAGSWGSPAPPASFLYYVYLLSVLGYRIGPLQDLADDQPLQTTHTHFLVFCAIVGAHHLLLRALLDTFAPLLRTRGCSYFISFYYSKKLVEVHGLMLVATLTTPAPANSYRNPLCYRNKTSLPPVK